MNRLESLQLYPVQHRRMFYLSAAGVFLFYTTAVLINFFDFSFQQASDFWYIPALLGVYCTWCIYSQPSSLEERQGPSPKRDIEADPAFLKEELEKAKRWMSYIVMGLAGVLFITIGLRPPFYREISQITNLLAMSGVFAAGSYFRQVLHIYSRIPRISEEEIRKSLILRGFFQILGWAFLGFFFLKTLGLKGRMGASWSGLPDMPLPNFLLLIALAVYLIGIIGMVLQILAEKTEGKLNSIFDACIAFGSTFPLVWLYSFIHPFLFLDIPAWLIQLPGLALVLIHSIGIYFSFQPSLQPKIIGNSCLWFVRHGEQVLTFIFLWAGATIYADMSPTAAALFYGGLFGILGWVANKIDNPVLKIAVAVIAVAPFLLKSGEFEAKIEARKASMEKIAKTY